MANYKIALDAGHGGSDPGAVYMGRAEKDDVLNLTLAVGDILRKNGIDVFYVRTTDEYETPFKKATDANNAGADLFVSIHRNSSETPNQYNGVQSLVYNDAGLKADIARNINTELEKAGFENLGISERPNLVVLKRTKMPAVMVEAGFINSNKDNEIFDNQFDKIAQAIADGILKSINLPAAAASVNSVSPVNPANPDNTIPDRERERTEPNANAGYTANQMDIIEDDETMEPLYRVQVGAYRNKENADRALNSLQMEGFPAFIIYEDDYYKVQVGAFRLLTNAIKMERRLRRFRYNTYIVYS